MNLVGVKSTGVLLCAAVLWACSDSSKQQAGAPSGATTQAVSMEAVPTYRVAETFNVGETAYVRSLRLDPRSTSLWVGTSVGVLEVDTASRNMRNTYTRDNGMANEYVFGILVDSLGNKWFGTNGGGVSRFDGTNWKTYFPMHGLADYWVYSFTEQKNGTIWIGTWAGLSALDVKTETFKTYLKELVNEWVYGLAVDSKDQLWIGTEGGVNLFDGQTWKTWTHNDGLGAPNENNLPVSPNTGLGTRTRHDLSVMLEGKPTYNPNYVFTLIVTPEDHVWAGTWGGGASRFDGATWTSYTTKEGLAGNIVYSIARQDDGTLWFGTNGGLSRYDGKSWTTLSKQEGLPDNNVYAIAVGAAGEVWVGTRGGVTLVARTAGVP